MLGQLAEKAPVSSQLEHTRRMEVINSSPSPPSSSTSGELRDMGSQVWTFIESQCWDTETGDIHTQNITFWLRTLLQQNSDLVEVVARLEKDAQKRVEILENKLEKTVLTSASFTDGLEDLHLRLSDESEDKCLLEEAITDLESKLQKTMEDNKASELLVDALSDKNSELENINERLKENMSVLEEDNQNLKDYIDNLRSDIDNLLKLSARARDSGVWDPHDLNFCEVTFEQVFGSEERVGGRTPVVKKISREEEDCHLADSRSSLRSELSDLQRRANNLSQCEDLSVRSEASTNKIRELRQQVLKLQQRGSENVKEVVMKDKLITELQTQITFLNNERDELKTENNANLSVIQRLKDNLNDTKTRLSVLEEEGEAASHYNYDRKVSSSASLPELPAPTFQATHYTSKFARSLTRQSNQTSLVQQLTDQLDIARREKQQLEDQRRDILAQMEISNTERLTLEDQLLRVRTELQDLMKEHDNLKDDFRTLVRKYDAEKERRKSPGKSVLADDITQSTVLSKTKMLHEAQKGHEALLATEQKLEAAIIQLQQREMEMGNVVHHVETINQQLFDRDIELGKEGILGNFLTTISSMFQTISGKRSVDWSRSCPRRSGTTRSSRRRLRDRS